MFELSVKLPGTRSEQGDLECRAQATVQTMMGSQTRQMKEAKFENKVRQDVLQERANHLGWQVHHGKDPVSPQTRRQILEERQTENQELKLKRGDSDQEEDFKTQPSMSVGRVLRNPNQPPAGVPLYCLYNKSSFEIRHKGLCLFQQAARKVIIRCRVHYRLASLRPLIQSMKRQSTGGADATSLTQVPDVLDERPIPLKLSQSDFLHFSFPVHSLPSKANEFDTATLGVVSVIPKEVQIKMHIPFFQLKVPQLYKLKGYERVSVFKAFTSFVPHKLVQLRSGAQDELMPTIIGPPECCLVDQEKNGTSVLEQSSCLTFTAPTAILRAPDTHPLRVFNPAAGLHAFKSPLPYQDCDLDFYLCPLPKDIVVKGTDAGINSPSTQKKNLDTMDVISGVMTWKKFPSAALLPLSSTSSDITSWLPCMSDRFNSDMLPAMAPPPLDTMPENLTVELEDGLSRNTGVVLTSEMVRAEFPLPESCQPIELKLESSKDERMDKRQQLELKFRTNIGAKVQARLSQITGMVKCDSI